MTTYLLDTHVVIWLLLGDREAVPADVVEAISDKEATTLVSAVSVREIAVKRSRGKLAVGDRWHQQLMRLDLEHLPVTSEHGARVETLPWHHRDRFDRLLVAQCLVERASLVTTDRALWAYEASTWWGARA